MALESFYTDVVITRRTHDGWENGAGTTSTIKGFVQVISGNETFQHLNLSSSVQAKLFCPIESDIRFNDLVTQNNITYKVVYADTSQGVSGTLHHREVLLSREGS